MGSKAVRETFGEDSESSKPHTVVYKSCNGSTKVSNNVLFFEIKPSIICISKYNTSLITVFFINPLCAGK